MSTSVLAGTPDAPRARSAALAPRLRWRIVRSALVLGAAVMGTGLALLPLLSILAHLAVTGWAAVGTALVTDVPQPIGVEGGGLGNGIAGSLLLVGLAALACVPVGVGAGLWVHEHRGTRAASALTFLADVLNGVPSIVIGITAWALLVRTTGRFSALAGAAALAMVAIPLVLRATSDVLAQVPRTLWEAGLALGYPRWRAGLTVVLATARTGVATGVLVALARIAGETAPLLFTAFGSLYWALDPRGPVAALPLQVYNMALSPFDAWRALAAAGALLLVVGVAGASVAARRALARLEGRA
jgi:phosphate transport system permease protein